MSGERGCGVWGGGLKRQIPYELSATNVLLCSREPWLEAGATQCCPQTSICVVTACRLQCKHSRVLLKVQSFYWSFGGWRGEGSFLPLIAFIFNHEIRQNISLPNSRRSDQDGTFKQFEESLELPLNTSSVLMFVSLPMVSGVSINLANLIPF